MFDYKKWNCSWSLVAGVASILALASVIHLFVFPSSIPSLKSFSSQQGQNCCTIMNVSTELGAGQMNLDRQFPRDLHNAVVYHGAPWKAKIGRWLAGCNAITKEVSIVEEISGNACKNDCSGHGVCNHQLGQCRCFHGYSGEGCSERLHLNCNYPKSAEEPYGRWVVSICAAYCDTTRAMCFCGEGTKYPNRPVAEACGFQTILPSRPGDPKLTNWAKADLHNIFTTNSSKLGWCNVDPEEAYASKVKFKEECDCKYDCLWGRFCEVPVQCTCLNQCSGHGHCRGGFCQCHNGWYGADCSIPSVLSSIGEWPRWLRPAQVDVPNEGQLTGSIDGLNAMVKKKRPLIYVYDLPPDFNSLLLEGRHFKFECVNRIYDGRNATLWTDQLYGSQMAFYESILASAHRTLNDEEADFFFVPVLDACIITRAADAPHINMQLCPTDLVYQQFRTVGCIVFFVIIVDSPIQILVYTVKHPNDERGLRSLLALKYYRKAYKHIVDKYPYWNRSSGRDHIWFFSWDEGACYAPKEIWNSMMLVHWGNTNTKHNHSTTAYWPDNWDQISSDSRGNHPCFDPDKDLVLPAWKHPDVNALSSKHWARTREERKTLFYFNGNLGSAYAKGRPEATYSMGIRQRLAEEFGSSPNKEGKLGKQHVPDVIVTPLRSEDYHKDLSRSVFCGVLPGDGWSGRMEDCVLQGCIPVVIQDGIFLPYENVLNYESFAVRIREDEIPNLINILRGFNDTEVEFKLANVQNVWQRFLYRDSILLEARRQKAALGFVEDWAVQFLQLNEDDVFATFIQVLHYKLHNDPWRRQLAQQKKEFGLPRECLVKK